MPTSTGKCESRVVVRIRLRVKVDHRNSRSRLGWIGCSILGTGQVVTSIATSVTQHSTALSCCHLLLLLLQLLLLLLNNLLLLLLKRGGCTLLLTRLLLVSELLHWGLLETKSKVVPILKLFRFRF